VAMFQRLFLLATLIACVAMPAIAAEPVVKKSEWQGFARLDFTVGERASFLIVPKQAAAGNPWIWRTEFFGHEPQADLALLAKGWHVAYTTMTNQYGAPMATDHMKVFHDEMVKTYQLNAKVVLEGFSRGGLFALNYAALHPEDIASLYLDAPVCDFKSWPAGFGKGKGSPADWARCKPLYGLADDTAAKAYRLNPIDNLAPLAKAKLPILAVVGDADDVVPLAENAALVKERYTALGGEMEMIVKPGCNHHPHSLKDPAPIVAFVLKHQP
jgi:predicted esterase